jgi:hypothetical protein
LRLRKVESEPAGFQQGFYVDDTRTEMVCGFLGCSLIFVRVQRRRQQHRQVQLNAIGVLFDIDLMFSDDVEQWSCLEDVE